MNGRAVKRFCVISIFSLVLSVAGAMSVSALTYSQDINVNFTFNSTLSLNLTSTDIVISSLVPNTAADSNIVNINVLTNSANGYTLNATVGNNTTYNTRDLVHSDTTQTAKFSSVDYSATPTITANSSLDPNTWAYSYSTDNGTTWANYNGLPLWSDNEHVATLKDSNAPVANTTGDAIKFKIAAKADASQSAGTYNNVINFTLVAKPVPTTPYVAFADAGKNTVNGYYKMQDMTPQICSAIETIEEQFQLIDTRDNKVYWVAKLADGNCWMTQNLDLDLGVNTLTHNSTTLYHDDTDLGWGETIDVNATWTPAYATETTPDYSWGYDYDPKSYDPGNYYWNGLFVDDPSLDWTDWQNSCYDYSEGDCWGSRLYYMPTVTSTAIPHHEIGNYYNALAGWAMNSQPPFSPGGKVEQSICPRGWTLPTGQHEDGGDNELEDLFDSYNTSLWDRSPYISLSGDLTDSYVSDVGGDVMYLTSSLYSDQYQQTGGYYEMFDVGYTGSHNSIIAAYHEFSTIRCIAR